MIARYPKKVKVLKKIPEKISFIKMFLWTSGLQFSEPRRKRNAQNTQISKKTYQFSNKIRKVHCTRRLQFWQPRWINFGNGGNILAHYPKNQKKISFFSGKFVSPNKISYGHVKCNCQNPAEKFSTMCSELFAQNSKKI